MKQLTIRFDEEIERRVRELAEREEISLNKAAIRLLRRGSGLEPIAEESGRIGNALDRFMGTLTKKEADEVRKGTEYFERIDEELWR